MHNENGRRSGERRGNVMVVGLMFGVLLGFSALSVDLGLVRLADTQLQASVDAAALSASSTLNGTTAGITAARNRAIAVAAMNKVVGSTVTLATGDITFGRWNGTTFTTYTSGSAAGVNAVRINHTPPDVGSVLGAVAFGIAGYDINARSMATRPLDGGTAKTSQCFLPFAVPDCWVSSTPPGTNPAPLKFTFNPSPTDAIAYATLSPPASATTIQSQMSNGCSNGTLKVGDDVYPNNGMITPALSLVANIINGNTAVPISTWDASLYGPLPQGLQRNGGPDTANLITTTAVSVIPNKWGNTWEGPVALVDAGTNCASVSFNANPLEVTGIAWGVVYDVRTSGSASQRNIYMQLDLINEHQIWGETDDDLNGNVKAYGESELVSW